MRLPELPEAVSRRLPPASWKRRLALALLALLAAGVLDVGRYLVWPPLSRLERENPRGTAFMELRQAQWAENGVRKNISHTWVPLPRISPHLVTAVTIAEDDKFWQHEGFDFEGMEDALLKNLEKGELRAGGSTITQQLAKNLYFSPSRNPVRKLKEALVAWRLEQALSKRRILELYLNLAEWGDGVFGAEAAARHWFGKSAAALTASDAARLAVVLPSPLRLSPVGESRYVAKRAATILERMIRRGAVVLPED